MSVEDFIQYFIVFIDTHYKHLQALLQTFICKRYLSHSEQSYKTGKDFILVFEIEFLGTKLSSSLF